MTSSLAKDITNTAKWLASLQDHGAGGWGEYKGAHTNNLNTAEAILALLASGECEAGDAIIQKGATYLVRSQLDATDALPEDAGAWSANRQSRWWMGLCRAWRQPPVSELSRAERAIMAFTILACLLVYGYLSEGSFVNVVLTQMKLQKKIASA